MRFNTWRKDSLTKLENIRTLINEKPTTIIVYRRGTTGDGFSTEIGNESVIGTQIVRIAPANNSYREIALELNIAVEDMFVAVAWTSDLQKGDVWEINSTDRYIVRRFGHFDFTYLGIVEVVLEKFTG